MRVSGIKDVQYSVWRQPDSPRVFLRIGWQRYAATPAEARELGQLLIAAANDESMRPQVGGPGVGDDDG
ncbi:hypothetical protein [Mycobacterium sp. ZZG]